MHVYSSTKGGDNDVLYLYTAGDRLKFKININHLSFPFAVVNFTLNDFKKKK